MRCGNCKQDHPSVADIRACYQSRGRTAVPQRLTKTVTENQVGFINQLMEQTGTPETELKGEPEQMTFQEASDTIVWLKEKRSSSKAESKSLPATIHGEQVPQGRYTVVFQEEGRITLRFRAPKNGKWRGTQLVEYLYGPNNDTDYRRCANWTGDGYRVWYQFREDGNIIEGIKYLVGINDDLRAEAGLTYALESSNCYRCGRTLTVPASIHRGLGPECAQIMARA